MSERSWNGLDNRFRHPNWFPTAGEGDSPYPNADTRKVLAIHGGGRVSPAFGNVTPTFRPECAGLKESPQPVFKAVEAKIGKRLEKLSKKQRREMSVVVLDEE
jgi:hypothetical protein